MQKMSTQWNQQHSRYVYSKVTWENQTIEQIQNVQEQIG